LRVPFFFIYIFLSFRSFIDYKTQIAAEKEHIEVVVVEGIEVDFAVEAALGVVENIEVVVGVAVVVENIEVVVEGSIVVGVALGVVENIVVEVEADIEVEAEAVFEVVAVVEVVFEVVEVVVEEEDGMELVDVFQSVVEIVG
jgi:hypothetical protein